MLEGLLFSKDMQFLVKFKLKTKGEVRNCLPSLLSCTHVLDSVTCPTKRQDETERGHILGGILRKYLFKLQ